MTSKIMSNSAVVEYADQDGTQLYNKQDLDRVLQNKTFVENLQEGDIQADDV